MQIKDIMWVKNKKSSLYLILSRLGYSFADIIKETLPRNKTEKRLFFGTFLLFILAGLFFQYHTDFSTLFSLLGYDLYTYTVGDALSPFKCLLLKIRHPLFVFYSLPFSLAAYLPQWLSGLPTVVPVLMLFANLFIALSVMLVWRICASVNRASSTGNLILVFLYVSFAHTLILSFTVDSFPFALLLFLIFISYSQVSKKEQNIYTDNLFFALFSGVTLTNGLKFVLTKFLDKEKLSTVFLKIVKSSILFILLVSVVLSATLFVYYFYVRSVRPDKTLAELVWGMTFQYVISYENIGFYKDIWGNFLVDPVLHYIPVLVSHTDNISAAVTDIHFLKHTCPLVLFYILTGISVLLNRKHTLVKLLLSFLSVDIFVHFVLRYGLMEGQIYSGHWLFVFPVLLALLANRITDKKVKVLYYSCLLLFAAYFFTQNTYTLYNQILQPS
ncbi:hypothetical protein Barb4_00317 [Bacteroidales bacterium Barb4]|nr:hypothetical protein Barb4_00317 [Bacteroidales bacterium Barb4]